MQNRASIWVIETLASPQWLNESWKSLNSSNAPKIDGHSHWELRKRIARNYNALRKPRVRKSNSECWERVA